MSIEAYNARDLRHHIWTGRKPHRRWFARAGRIACLLVLITLTTCIVIYIRLTDPDRVRSLAETYFHKYVEADIKIGHARLSLFDGLQLDDVVISSKGGGEHAAIVSAKRLQVSYEPLALLAGHIESARVIAIEPEVYLVEDETTGRWNLQGLQRPSTEPKPTTTKSPPSPLPPLPEVLIRGGSVHRAQVRAGKYETIESIRLEGQFLPRVDVAGEYAFNLQSRTTQGAAGPTFQGNLAPGDAAAESTLTNVELAFLEPLLPARVRSFWRMLDPAGRVDVPVLRVTRGTGDSVDFHIELQLADVRMTVRPTDWASAAERATLREPDKIESSLARLPVDTSLLAAAVELQPKLRTGSVPLEGVHGRFVFTQDGVTLDKLAATVDGNPFEIRGHLGGYSIDAPMDLHVASPADHPIELRAPIPYIDALPAEIREVYYRFAPRGQTKLAFSLSRVHPSGQIAVAGGLEFANAAFTFQEFRFPVRNASGKLIVDADPHTGEPRLKIDHVRGNGPADGPNASAVLAVDGVIAPLIGYASVDVAVSGKDVHSEPALVAALPSEARAVIAEFDDDGPGPDPIFSGDFDCRVKREPGAISRWTYDTDVKIRDGRGALKAFPFPLENLAVDLAVRKEFVQIASARSTHGGGTVEVSGLTEWGHRVNGGRPRKIGDPGARTSLTLKARDLPVDDALRNALPADARNTLARLGVSGKIDLTGPITVADPRADPEFDFTIEARDARLAPAEWKTSIDAIAATMQVTPRLVKIDRAVGRRGDAKVTASGLIDLSTPAKPTITFDASADALVFDAALRDSLPAPARPVWDSLKPAGTAAATLHLTGEAASPTWAIEVTPHGDASLDRPDFLPLAMTGLTGTIHANADRLDLANVSAKVASGTASVTGTGEFGQRSTWALKLQTTDTLVDRPLLDALPKALGATLKDNDVAGRADLDFRRLDWTTSPDGKSTDIVFDTAATLRDASWRTGVTFDKAAGTVVLRGHFIDDDPAELSGDMTLRTFRLAGMDAHDGSATIVSDPASKRMVIKDIRSNIGAGELAGEFDLDRARADQTRWAASFLLRNADVASITAGSPTKMTGQLNASLAIEGAWGNTTNGVMPFPRRGRGDISVSGKDMVNVPMVLGITQVVSLKLPFTGGFNDATASYSLDGDRVSFSDIDLQSSEMHIKGAGWLDFDKKQVNLDFYTDSSGKKLPVIGHLLDAARRELFQIKVRGTLEEPEVKAGSLRTITTTVDEIMNSDKK